VFIALVPFIILLIASGKLKEVKGPGGIALLMKDEAEKEISLDVEDNALEFNPEIVHAKGGLQSLRQMINEKPPTAISFVLEGSNYYGQNAIEEYLNKLQKLSEFKHIIFVSKEGKFSGYTEVTDFTRIVEEGGVVEKIENASIMHHKNIHKEFIRINISNREALSAMEKADVNELAVVDGSGKFIGIINQDQIVRKILSKVVRKV
jgi:CBS domain-containing protein